jgi:superfamily II DNA/RNA helicase
MPNYRYRSAGRSNHSGYQSSRSSRSRGPKKEYVNPARFVQSAKSSTSPEYISQHKFSDFNLHPVIQSNLQQIGLLTPTAIQDQTIPAGLAGRDVVGLADTGTGKTAAFAIPLLNRLLVDASAQAIILAPTRELAQQIDQQCRDIARGSGIYRAVLIGGSPMGPQLADLREKPQLIIGTPGRIKDHLERRSLSLTNCNIVVLDEVDRMLDMGFVNDIKHILNLTSPHKQSFYFSATLDNRVKAIIESFSVDPLQVNVKLGNTSDNVEQNIVSYNSPHDKIDKLHDLLIKDGVTKALIFDDTHRSVERLSKELTARGFIAESMHGGKSQSQRQRVLRMFRDNQIKVLVATDVAGRGLDVTDITHVINYSSPQSYNDYVHRIGRTGRAGKTGYALTFIEK